MLTGDGLRRWRVVGTWLKPLRPEFLFLTACEAGGSAVVRELFDEIDSLREVYASPSPLAVNQTPMIGALVFSLLKTGRINSQDSQILRAAGFILTGGQLFRWRRREFGSGQELQALWGDVAAQLLRSLTGGSGA
jgi:hypothetical protein